MGPAILVQCRNPPVLTQMFVMEREKGQSKEGAPIATDESVCLDAPEKDDTMRTPRVRVIACSGYARQAWRWKPEVSTLLQFIFHIHYLILFVTLTRFLLFGTLVFVT